MKAVLPQINPNQRYCHDDGLQKTIPAQRNRFSGIGLTISLRPGFWRSAGLGDATTAA